MKSQDPKAFESQNQCAYVVHEIYIYMQKSWRRLENTFHSRRHSLFNSRHYNVCIRAFLYVLMTGKIRRVYKSNFNVNIFETRYYANYTIINISLLEIFFLFSRTLSQLFIHFFYIFFFSFYSTITIPSNANKLFTFFHFHKDIPEYRCSLFLHDFLETTTLPDCNAIKCYEIFSTLISSSSIYIQIAIPNSAIYFFFFIIFFPQNFYINIIRLLLLKELLLLKYYTKLFFIFCNHHDEIKNMCLF